MGLSEIRVFGTVRRMVICAMLCAVSVVVGKIPAIEVSDVIRFTLENFSVILAGFAFGPIMGGVTGAVSDLVGCVIKGYSVNPIITLGALAVGATAGLIRMLLKNSGTVSLLVAVFASHIIGNIIIKSVGLYVWYAALRPTLIFRIPTYFITAAVEFLILYFILKNKQARKLFLGDGQ